MGWYTESRRDLHTFVWLYSLLFVLNIQTVYTDDGILEARALPWYAGMRIDLKCTIYPTACKGAGDRPEQTIFKNSLSSFCAVAVTANCLDKPLGDMENPPGKCWCVKDAQTNFTTYVYRFFADPSLHNGTWTCVKGCYVNGAITPVDLTINNAAGASKTVQAKPTPKVACAADIKTVVIEPERSEAVCLEKPKEDTTWKEIAIAFIVITAVCVCVIAFLIIIIIKMRNKEEKQMIAFRAKVLDAFPAKKNVTCTDTELKITGDNYNEIFKGVVKVLKIMLVEFDKTFTLTREEWPQPKNVDKFTQNVQKRIANIKTVTAKNTEVKITGANYDEIFKGVVEVWIIMVDEYENDR